MTRLVSSSREKHSQHRESVGFYTENCGLRNLGDKFTSGMQKTRANPSANNGSVSKSVSQTVLRLSFDGFAPGIVRLTHLEQVEHFLATLHQELIVQTLKNKNSVSPATFAIKLS